MYLEIPTLFNGITVHQITNNIPDRIMPYLKYKHDKVFELKSDEKLFYVVASNCCIGKSDWLEEDRVINPTLQYDYVYLNIY